MTVHLLKTFSTPNLHILNPFLHKFKISLSQILHKHEISLFFTFHLLNFHASFCTFSIFFAIPFSQIVPVPRHCATIIYSKTIIKRKYCSSSTFSLMGTCATKQKPDLTCDTDQLPLVEHDQLANQLNESVLNPVYHNTVQLSLPFPSGEAFPSKETDGKPQPSDN